jgi:Icc-related predicted phosphoesterase
MCQCFFVSDLHGKIDRYEKLFNQIKKDSPALVLFGGDLYPHGTYKYPEQDFLMDFFVPNLRSLKHQLNEDYPGMMIILGNDDPGTEGQRLINLESEGLWKYIHMKKTGFRDYNIYGYAFIPPSPFRFKDWERYDVSRYVDPGCIPPDEGIRTVDPGCDIEYTTIQQELEQMINGDDMTKAIFLFHSPPYKTHLDRASLDGMMIDHVPLDVHVGSIAIKRMVEEKQPMVTLHGHIHESARLTGHWQQQLGRTMAFNAAHDGPELSLVVFDLDNPSAARRYLI